MGYVNPLVGGISAISGLLGGMNEKRRQQSLMQSAMSHYGQSIDAQNNNAMGNQLEALYSGTGMGNDSVRNSGMALADALGRGGVTNSSALAGALANQSIGNAANVAGMYSQMDAARRGQYAQGQQNLANMQLGVGGSMYNNAQNQLAGTANGLQSWLQGMTQQANQRTGVSAQMNGLGMNNGNAGKGGFGGQQGNVFGAYSPFGDKAVTNVRNRFQLRPDGYMG